MNRFISAFILIIPSIVAYLTLQFTHDAVLSIIGTTIFAFIIPCYILDSQVQNFEWQNFLGRQTVNLSIHLCNGK